MRNGSSQAPWRGGDGASSPAEKACAYVLAKVRARAGPLWNQGPRLPPIPCRSSSREVRIFAERRLHRVPAGAARALVAWGEGFPVELLEEVPSPLHVLELQAKGRRCVSLLPEGTPTSPHIDALAFALHDLCHLDKFIDPRHYAGQLGFFACVHASIGSTRWQAFERGLDPAFRTDFHHVAADMNGSAVFLFAALKMKLKMAVRRRLAAERGDPAVQEGPLSPEETRAYEPQLEELLCLLNFEPSIASAARHVSAKRGDPRAAVLLLAHFEEVGSALQMRAGRVTRACGPKYD